MQKKSNGELERYASDDSGRWQERLASYGIVQNEWRMIEELNLTKAEAELLWKENDSFEKCVEKLFAYSDALSVKISESRAKTESIENEKARLNRDIEHIEWEKASDEYYKCKEAFDRENENLRLANNAKAEAIEKAEEANKRHRLLKCAFYYSQLRKIKSKIIALDAEITDRESNSAAVNRLASLKYSANIAIKTELERITPELEQAASDKNNCKKTIDAINEELAFLRKSINDARSEVDKAEAVLERARKESSALVDELNIGIFRMLDDKYRDDELTAWQKETQAKEKSILNELTVNTEKLQNTELQKEIIPQKIADTKSNLKELDSAVGELVHKLDEFRIAESNVKTVIEKYVLEPMFEISKNYNVQMLCLSDISKSDIVSCFDLVIRVVVKQFALSSKEQLTHDDNEAIEHGFYRSEQLALF